jgi:hypothetical protein
VSATGELIVLDELVVSDEFVVVSVEFVLVSVEFVLLKLELPSPRGVLSTTSDNIREVV